MVNKLVLSFVIFLLTACSSKQVSPETQNARISVSQVDELKLGESIDLILKIVGSPAGKLMNEGELVWIYRDPTNGNQRAAFGLDGHAKLLRDKTIILSEADPESNINYLLKEKFKTSRFVKVRFPQCGRDFVSDDILLVAESDGIVIQFSRTQNVASAISWSSTEDVRQDIKNILECRRSRVSN